MTKLLVCDQPVIKTNGVPRCDSWQQVDLESLVTQAELFELRELLEFDPVLFGTLVTGLILVFVAGHTAGTIVRTMKRGSV